MLARKPSALSGRSPKLPKSVPAILSVKAPFKLTSRAVADVEAPPAAAPEFQPRKEDEEKAFPFRLPMDEWQQRLASLPIGLFYPAVAVLTAGAAGIGFLGVKAVPEKHMREDVQEVAAMGVAAALVAAGVAAGAAAKQKRDSAAIVDLYNQIVDLPDPTVLTPDVVASVGEKFGVDMLKDQLDGVQRIYAQYLESLIPTDPEKGQLRGDEAQKVTIFMNALGLSVEDVATVHLDLGRKLFRLGFETRDRQTKFEQRKAFQRLVYVSAGIFGDQKMATLLPWKEEFGLNDAQMFVARRDNAKAIFKSHLEALGGKIPADADFLRQLRAYAEEVKMMDESAEEIVREVSRLDIEAHLLTCLDIMKSVGKSRDVAGLCREIDALIEYTRKLNMVGQEEGVIAGVKAPTIEGGVLMNPASSKVRELKEVYKVYLGEQLDQLGEFTPALDDDMAQLEAVLCIPAKEAQILRDETSARLYKKLLRDEVQSKRIDEAADPSAILRSIADKVRFSKEAAAELHKQLYKQKLGTLIEDKMEFSPADEADLARVRHVLCISDEIAKKAERETCGKELENLLGEIFLMGAKPVPEMEMEKMDKLVKGLRIEPDVCVEILRQAALEKFRAYVKAAQKESWDRKAAATIMKRLVQFNSLVVTPLLEHMKRYAGHGEITPAEPATSSRKAGEFFEEEREGQSEITLRGEIEPAYSAVMYKQYMMYSMAGEVIELPVGGEIRKKISETTRHVEAGRLFQLGQILGMSQAEMDAAQADLAEEAYKEQVMEVTRSGAMTEERAEYLEELRIKMGISKVAGAKISRAVRTELMGSNSTEEEGGRGWTLDRAIQLFKAGGSVETVMEEVTRRNLFRRELTNKITDGSGDLDHDYIIKYLPEVLELPTHKVTVIVKELVGTRRRMLLVQSVSQLRQKQGADAIKSLNNLISCCKAMPDKTPMPWTEPQELRDLYQAYCERESNSDKQAVLQNTFGITDEEAMTLRAASQSSEGPRVSVNKDDESFF